MVKLLQLLNAFISVVQLFCAEFIFTLINELHEPKVLCKLVIIYVVGIVIDINEEHCPNAPLIFTPLADNEDGNTTFCN